MVKDMLKRSPDIDSMVSYWDKVDALLNGYEAVRKAGTIFLPAFPNETQDDYAFRLQTTKLTNVYRDVTEGLATKPFQDEIMLIKGDSLEEIPEFVSEFVENVDGAGNNLTTFSALTFFNAINYGIDWVMVDYPTVENADNISVTEAKSRNIKPYWVRVLGSNVLEIQTAMFGSKEKITYFRYKEPSEDGKKMNVRVYRLGLSSVFWDLYEKVENSDDEWIVTSSGEMTIDEIPIVPLIIGRRDGNTWKLFPPMQDACDLQIKLYQNESALEYIKTLACYPMLATDGTKAPKDASGKPVKIAVGPNRVLYGVATDDGRGGTWRYVEPSANSLEFLQKNINSTKQDLRELGRQPLTALSSQLTTVTTSIAAGKAKSAVTAWAYALKDTLENLLMITCKWMKSDYQPQVNVFTGFDNVTDDDKDLDILLKMRENRDLSWETLITELKRRKILSPEITLATESERLLSELTTGEDL